ncbi:MAG: hypothetical protein K2F74_05330 [Muribaculaceae bacterium]|nr:hypothetical protein [Muribaculaceae bacterium]
MKIIAKIGLALAFCAAITPSVFAQETTSKPNVFIDYFWRPADLDFNIAEQVRNNVIEAINATNRVELIDVDSRSALVIEKERRMTGQLAAEDDLSRIAVMKEEGANALIQGRITSLVIKRNDSKDGSYYYDATINYTLKAINPNDGKLISTKTIKVGDELLNLKTYKTADEAAMGIAKDAQRGVASFIEEAFPIIGTILEAAEVKKDDIKTAYISVGNSAGVKEGNKFSVCIERTIAGRKSQSVIGEAEIESVEGDDISLVKIKKGGKELKSAMDAGQTIVVKSIPKKERAGFSI